MERSWQLPDLQSRRAGLHQLQRTQEPNLGSYAPTRRYQATENIFWQLVCGVTQKEMIVLSHRGPCVRIRLCTLGTKKLRNAMGEKSNQKITASEWNSKTSWIASWGKCDGPSLMIQVDMSAGLADCVLGPSHMRAPSRRKTSSCFGLVLTAMVAAAQRYVVIWQPQYGQKRQLPVS